MRLLKKVDRSGFGLRVGERALIRAESTGGSLLATNLALHLLGDGEERLEWWQINHVLFDPAEMRLRITTEGGVRELVLAAPTFLPETIRERVTATILTSTALALPGPAKAVISLRRRPKADGDETFVQIDWEGTPTPAARAEAERRGRLLAESLVFSSPVSLR